MTGLEFLALDPGSMREWIEKQKTLYKLGLNCIYWRSGKRKIRKKWPELEMYFETPPEFTAIIWKAGEIVVRIEGKLGNKGIKVASICFPNFSTYVIKR